ncbi:MAG: MFS transporter [Pseudomonadota bacterium]|nr:MFS transporter [Pseudomonadota bacterium]
MKFSHLLRNPYSVITIAAMFYLYEFFIRVSPSVITNELMRDFQIHAGYLGFLSSLFYYSYTAMQIPAGLLGDKFGPRKVLIVAALICSVALLIMANAQQPLMIGVSRLLIGFACSFGYIGPLMLASKWFAKEKFSMITGFIQALGCVGATIGTGPISHITAAHGWRVVMIYSSIAGAILAILFAIIVRDKPKGYSEDIPMSKISETQILKYVLAKKQTWITGILGFCFWSPIAVFAELWGVNFLMEIHKTTAPNVSGYIIWIWIGIAIGAPLFGWYSNFLCSRKKPIIIGFLLGLISSFGIVFFHPLNSLIMDFLMFTFGASASAMVITFGLVNDNNPENVVGTAIGFNNMSVILGATILQPITGFILNLLWDGKIVDSHPVYGLTSYVISFSILPLFSLIGLLICIFSLKETNCRRIHETN